MKLPPRCTLVGWRTWEGGELIQRLALDCVVEILSPSNADKDHPIKRWAYEAAARIAWEAEVQVLGGRLRIPLGRVPCSRDVGVPCSFGRPVITPAWVEAQMNLRGIPTP